MKGEVYLAIVGAAFAAGVMWFVATSTSATLANLGIKSPVEVQ